MEVSIVLLVSYEISAHAVVIHSNSIVSLFVRCTGLYLISYDDDYSYKCCYKYNVYIIISRSKHWYTG